MHAHRTLTIGILAHVDAGKTSLTERLLYDTGAISVLGSVDAGTTQTDTAAIERARGITVRSAVVSFVHDGITVAVVDTPGHADFVAEVERALSVLDAAVLVVSATDGVRQHTRFLLRALRSLRLPTLIAINKTDRSDADPHAVLSALRRESAALVLPMNTENPEEITERLATVDDEILTRTVAGPGLTADEICCALGRYTRSGRILPAYRVSARTGAGVAVLLDGITGLLRTTSDADPAAVPRGTVFALERSPSGTKVAYLRLTAGTLRLRQRVTLYGRTADGTEYRHSGRITAIRVIGHPNAHTLPPGDIGAITGPSGIRVGDRLAADDIHDREHLTAPTQWTVVRPRTGSSTALHAALRQLAEHDPTLGIRLESDGATAILVYGEIQCQIIAAALAADPGIEVDFQPAQPLRVQVLTGAGTAGEEIAHRRPGPSGYWATLTLRVEPLDTGSGIRVRFATERGALPAAFRHAIESSARTGLRHGPHGYAITDCLVTVLRTGYAGPLSTAADFRALTAVLVDRAVRAAGTRLLDDTPHPRRTE